VVGLECLVGASFATTELLQLPATFALLHSPCCHFGFAGDSHWAIADLRKILSCVRRHASFEFANSQSAKISRTWWTASAHNCSIAGCRPLSGCIRIRDRLLSRVGRVLRIEPCVQLQARQICCAAAPPNRREFATARPAIRSL